MCQQIEHAMALHHGMSSRQSNVVSGFNCQKRTDFDVGIDQDHVAHFSGAYVVNPQDAGRLQ